MKINEIGVWSCARLSSTRCKEKMVRRFGDSTLTDIFLAKANRLGENAFFGGHEQIFKEKCESHGVRFVQRSAESAFVDEPAKKIYEFLCDQPYEYLLQVNACLPFLKTETIQNFLETCRENDKPKFAVFKKNNYYTSTSGRPLNFGEDLTTINTKNVTTVNEFAHVFYFFPKSTFVKTGWYWDWSKVDYIEIEEGLGTFDIDTEEQFQMADALWNRFGSAVE